jgi:hypothetical protein
MAEAAEPIGSQTTDASTKDEPQLAGMLLKDAAVAFAALSIWAAADTWHQVTGLWIAQVLAVGDAILVGLVLAFLFHEWGHYAGAMAAKAHAPRVPSKGLSLFRFNFIFADNDARAFHWMTYGGHILHWSILLLLLFTLPLDSLGRITLVSSLFGFVVFATVIEYNIVKDTWSGADPETRLNQLNREDFKQASLIGTLGGLFAIALLS